MVVIKPFNLLGYLYVNTKSIKGTCTEQSFLRSLVGESQVRNRYTYFTGVARKEGYCQIEAVSLEAADQGKEHIKRFFKFLEGGELEIAVVFPAGIIGTTAENLRVIVAGKHCEAEEMYPKFADIADEEGLKEIAAVYRNVAKTEHQHEMCYLKLLGHVESGKYFERDKEIYRQCRDYGFMAKAKKAPAKCPACAHSQEFFKPMAENF